MNTPAARMRTEGTEAPVALASPGFWPKGGAQSPLQDVLDAPRGRGWCSPDHLTGFCQLRPQRGRQPDEAEVPAVLRGRQLASRPPNLGQVPGSRPPNN
ncbi:hypothetical protein HPG69_018587 [Diceros bicornis minor]|uniref:Uncharacterized protein n=1 Tax=Diceros bicornis minor TaxID=77932 RepID=A0A7J7EZP4_DICBM|nr:hypothetical protein HPG69_018587 [Diceros bicornis minor]